jgi:hypothetical protein
VSCYLRYLRIAFSAFCGLACVLLVVLWVRSYSVNDGLYRGQSQVIGIVSYGGVVEFGRFDNQVPKVKLSKGWNVFSDRVHPDDELEMTYYIRRAEWPFGECLIVPYWIPVLSAAMIAAAPWFRWRFSLRTLLVAMTVVAVVIGVIVAEGR